MLGRARQISSGLIDDRGEIVFQAHQDISALQRYQKFFIAAQKEAPEDVETFAKTLQSMSYAEHRYDSRSRPLLRFFKLLPIAVATLVKLVENGSASEAAHATELLGMLSGDCGFKRIVGAAVAADSMILGWTFIKLSDKSSGDYALSGPAAARQLHEMEALLKHGGLFLQEAKGSLTHTALESLCNQVVFFQDKMLVLRWPERASARLDEPRRLAKKPLDEVVVVV